MENEQADAGRGPNLFHETKISGANGDGSFFVLFLCYQLITSRIGDPVNSYSAKVTTIYTS